MREWLIIALMAICDKICTVIRTAKCEMEVALCQILVSGPKPFALEMNV